MRSAAELVGLVLVVAGVAAVYWPAAVIVAGLGLVFYAQGGEADDSANDDDPGSA